jgi:hypothetical protein
MADDVVRRTSVRVVLIAPDDRVLMLGVRSPDDGRQLTGPFAIEN